MLEHIANFTAWPILTGIFIGYIANRIMSGEGKGCCMNFIIGIAGSYAGHSSAICSILNCLVKVILPISCSASSVLYLYCGYGRDYLVNDLSKNVRVSLNHVGF